jgi:hypothetical protein
VYTGHLYFPDFQNDAEIEAIKLGTQKLLNSNFGTWSVVFLTNSKSALQALQFRKFPDLQGMLAVLCTQHKVAMQWIPPHCGIPGNEKADRLAKEGSTDKQSDTSVTYHQMKQIIKSIRKPQVQTQDDYHNMNRSVQVVIFHLRTGHKRLLPHVY